MDEQEVGRIEHELPQVVPDLPFQDIVGHAGPRLESGSARSSTPEVLVAHGILVVIHSSSRVASPSCRNCRTAAPTWRWECPYPP